MTLKSLVDYGHNFQIKVIASLLTSREFLIDIYDSLDETYFNNQAHQWVIKQIKQYFDQYHTTISVDILKIELKKIENDVLKLAVREQLEEAYNISTEDLRYAKEEFFKFCKNQKMKNAIMASVDYLKLEDYDSIRSLIIDAVKSGEHKDIGHDYSKDAETRYRDEERNPIPFPWEKFNELTQGGYGAGDLVLIIGNPGGAKSWTLVSMMAHAAKLGKKVVYYTLELSESYIGKRLDANLYQIEVDNLKHNRKEIDKICKELPGSVIIKGYPPKKASIQTIENHLEQLKHQHNFEPDVIFIDYLDYLKNKVRRKEKKEDIDDVYVSAKGLAVELKKPIVSPSQANRTGAKDSILEGDKTAGSYDKIMIGDIVISLSRQKKDKINKTGRFFWIKNRYGPDGMAYAAKVDASKGNIEILGEVSSDSEDEVTNNNSYNSNGGLNEEEKYRASNKFLQFFNT